MHTLHTRLALQPHTQVRALATICASPLKGSDVSSVLEPTLTELTGFLRKANRMLRQASLVALEVRGGEGGRGY